MLLPRSSSRASLASAGVKLNSRWSSDSQVFVSRAVSQTNTATLAFAFPGSARRFEIMRVYCHSPEFRLMRSAIGGS